MYGCPHGCDGRTFTLTTSGEAKGIWNGADRFEVVNELICPAVSVRNMQMPTSNRGLASVGFIYSAIHCHVHY